MTPLRKKISPGVVLGVVAIAIALGGTSIAGPGNPVSSVKVKTAEVPVTLPADLGPNQGRVETTATCPKKTKVVGGGVLVNSGPELDDQDFLESGPIGNNAWLVVIDNGEPTTIPATVYAKCLKVT